jgi:hypothetical protein
MIRRFAAAILSIFLVVAATISLNDELESPVITSQLTSDQGEISVNQSDDPGFPDYPDAISQRLLRNRISPRALVGERSASVIFVSSFCGSISFCAPRRSFLQDLYQHQTNLRI